jgi:hypothetical protein
VHQEDKEDFLSWTVDAIPRGPFVTSQERRGAKQVQHILLAKIVHQRHGRSSSRRTGRVDAAATRVTVKQHPDPHVVIEPPLPLLKIAIIAMSAASLTQPTATTVAAQ